MPESDDIAQHLLSHHDLNIVALVSEGVSDFPSLDDLDYDKELSENVAAKWDDMEALDQAYEEKIQKIILLQDGMNQIAQITQQNLEDQIRERDRRIQYLEMQIQAGFGGGHQT